MDQPDWNRPLFYRRGSPHRLDGIDLFYEFDWYEVFPDERAQFRNGRVLALLVREDCPMGKLPALLLTMRDEVEECTLETSSHYVVVLNLRKYLAQAAPNAAASYYARTLGSGITRIGELAARPDVVAAVVEQSLGIDDIAGWAADNNDRVQLLRGLVGQTGQDSSNPGRIAAAMSAIEALDSIDEDVAAALEGLLSRQTDPKARARLLRALTEDSLGRKTASRVLSERLADRIGDVRRVLDEYAVLIGDPGSNETRLQQFIEANPLILGLDYARVRPRVSIMRGQLDFFLERSDGFHDLLELKNPGDPIIVSSRPAGESPPSASAYSLSPALSQALTQVLVYRETLSAYPDAADTLYGLRNARDPRVIIVVGRADRLESHERQVLTALNRTLHRVEVIPYDTLAQRSRTIFDNVERLTESSAMGD